MAKELDVMMYAQKMLVIVLSKTTSTRVSSLFVLRREVLVCIEWGTVDTRGELKLHTRMRICNHIILSLLWTKSAHINNKTFPQELNLGNITH